MHTYTYIHIYIHNHIHILCLYDIHVSTTSMGLSPITQKAKSPKVSIAVIPIAAILSKSWLWCFRAHLSKWGFPKIGDPNMVL